jgi:hypothetical protein
MIDLKKITRGKESRPPRVLIYSFEGIGKTRFATGAPDPFFLDFDRGSHMYDAARMTPETWGETKEWIAAIGAGSVKCRTVVLDSITALEPISHAEIFAGTSIEQWEGGFNKGEGYAVSQWKSELIAPLERLWLGGKTIVLIAHAVVKKFEDPSGPGYERFTVGVRPKLGDFLKQWADYVLFAREEVLTVGKKGERPKATTTGTRYAYTRRTPAYDAKSRGTLLFPEKILLSWDEFAGAIASEKARAEEMGASIEAMLTELADPSLTKQVRDWLKQNPDKLVEASQSLQAKIESARAQKLEEKAFAPGPTPQANPNGS